ncbi:hypothetical protein BgiBS90_023944 [Biomphalaria glabrata]|nr:hypothetical protein BgiBS90_023944 [Biomphalaria glabrata]
MLTYHHKMLTYHHNVDLSPQDADLSPHHADLSPQDADLSPHDADLSPQAVGLALQDVDIATESDFAAQTFNSPQSINIWSYMHPPPLHTKNLVRLHPLRYGSFNPCTHEITLSGTDII